MKGKKILVGVTGSVAAYRAADVCSKLVAEGADVTVIMTKEAQEFIQPLTFQSLTGNDVVTDLFRGYSHYQIRHISLAENADLLLIVPATANIIGKLASGILDDILTCTAYSLRAPVIIAPAMNPNMFNHPIHQQNIEKLKRIGYHFVGPKEGRLACGIEGMGHIADTEEILATVRRVLARDD